MFAEIGVPLSDSYELYLEFDEDDLSCGYYIVDHSKRCIFWLEEVNTENIGMNPSFSTEHLREYPTPITTPLDRRSSDHPFPILGYELEEMYWSHVEFYPSHTGIPMNGVIDNLLNTLVHAQGGVCMRNHSPIDVFLKPVPDALTSDVSTFPYSAEESARFAKLIRPYQGRQIDGNIICVVARLNSYLGASTALL